MICRIFLIIPQEHSDAGQLETQVAVRLVGLSRAICIAGPRLEFPLGLPRAHTSDEGGEEGQVVIVDQRHLAEWLLARVRMLYPYLDLTIEFFMRLVLRNEVLKLKPRNEANN